MKKEFNDAFERLQRARELFEETVKTILVLILVASAVFVHVAVHPDYDIKICLFLLIWDLSTVVAVMERLYRFFFSKLD